MTKKPFLIIPAILILHSLVLSLASLYTGPSPYASRGFRAVWPQLFTLLAAAFFAKKLKAKYWGISIIALALSGFPRALVATVPAYTHLLVAVTLALDLVSATALFLAFRHDTFDLSMWEGKQALGTSYLIKLVIVLLIIAGIFLYFGRP